MSPYYIRIIRLIYLCLAIVWICLIYMYNLGGTGTLCLLIPLVLFGLNASNVACRSIDADLNTNKTAYLALAVFVIWIIGPKNPSMVRIVALFLVLTLIVYLNVWVPECWVCVYRHFTDGIHTMAISLLMYIVVTYYTCDSKP